MEFKTLCKLSQSYLSSPITDCSLTEFVLVTGVRKALHSKEMPEYLQHL